MQVCEEIPSKLAGTKQELYASLGKSLSPKTPRSSKSLRLRVVCSSVSESKS